MRRRSHSGTTSLHSAIPPVRSDIELLERNSLRNIAAQDEARCTDITRGRDTLVTLAGSTRRSTARSWSWHADRRTSKHLVEWDEDPGCASIVMLYHTHESLSSTAHGPPLRLKYPAYTRRQSQSTLPPWNDAVYVHSTMTRQCSRHAVQRARGVHCTSTTRCWCAAERPSQRVTTHMFSSCSPTQRDNLCSPSCAALNRCEQLATHQTACACEVIVDLECAQAATCADGQSQLVTRHVVRGAGRTPEGLPP